MLVHMLAQRLNINAALIDNGTVPFDNGRYQGILRPLQKCGRVVAHVSQPLKN